MNENKEKLQKYFKIISFVNAILLIVIPLTSLVNIYISNTYAKECSKFYGIEMRYFDASLTIQNKFIFAMVSIIFLCYPYILYYIAQKSKKCIFKTVIAGAIFLFSTIVIFFQMIVYTGYIINIIRYKFITTILDNFVAVILFFMISVVISYYLILRKNLEENEFLKKCNLAKYLQEKFEIIFLVAFVVYSVVVSIGFCVYLNSDISDKRSYEIFEYKEVIDDKEEIKNKVIITDYEGKFIVMNCEIEGENLHIKKEERYDFIEMTGVKIQYKEFENVTCE